MASSFGLRRARRLDSKAHLPLLAGAHSAHWCRRSDPTGRNAFDGQAKEVFHHPLVDQHHYHFDAVPWCDREARRLQQQADASLHLQSGERDTAAEYFSSAAVQSHEYCFPFRLESEKVLRAAVKVRPRDARAWYYLGNLLYEPQPEQAMEHWERARRTDSSLAIVHRNLGWGYVRRMCGPSD